MGQLLTSENLIALLTLTAMEIVLGIDNIVFIALLSGRLEPAKRALARRLGLGLAMGVRILLLLGIRWISRLTHPLFSVVGHSFAGRDLVFLGGGLFLLAKATYEIHDRVQPSTAGHELGAGSQTTMVRTIVQIVALDIVFSLDSVITAVGMAQALWVMIAAIVLAVIVMMIFAGPVTNLLERHPTIKMLALAFLVLIGVMLLAEGFGRHIEKGYIYFAMAFSLGVELLNMRAARHGPSEQS